MTAAPELNPAEPAIVATKYAQVILTEHEGGWTITARRVAGAGLTSTAGQSPYVAHLRRCNCGKPPCPRSCTKPARHPMGDSLWHRDDSKHQLQLCHGWNRHAVDKLADAVAESYAPPRRRLR